MKHDGTRNLSNTDIFTMLRRNILGRLRICVQFVSYATLTFLTAKTNGSDR